MRIIKIIFAIGLLIWLFYSSQLPLASLSEVFFSWSHGSWWWVVVVLLLGNFLGQIKRWLLLLALQKIRLSWITGIRLSLIGQFFFITSLGAVGGEVARGYYVVKHAAGARLAAASTVVMDRVMGLFTYLLVGGGSFLGLWWWGEPSTDLVWFGWGILLMLMGLVMIVAMIWSAWGQRVLFGYLPEGWQELLQQVVTAYRCLQRPFLLTVLLSLATNLLHMLAFMAASQALGISLGWGELLLTVPLVVVANSLPMPMGGLGVGETAAQFLLIQLGIPHGAMIMLLLRMTQWLIVLPSGFYCYLAEKS